MGAVKRKVQKVKRKARKYAPDASAAADAVISEIMTPDKSTDSYAKMLRTTLIEITREYLSEHAKEIVERAQKRIELKQKLMGHV